MERFCIVDLNFLILTREFQLINECTFREFRDLGLSLGPCYSRSQTFHILTEEPILQTVRDRYSEQLQFNQKYFHQIPIEYGGIPVSCFSKQFNQEISHYSAVFVKGSQKALTVKSLLQSSSIPVFDLDTFFCPSHNLLGYKYPTVFQQSCILHHSAFHYCTAHKAEIYAKWMKDNFVTLHQFWTQFKQAQQQAPSSLSHLLHPPEYYLAHMQPYSPSQQLQQVHQQEAKQSTSGYGNTCLQEQEQEQEQE
jgi:hypothetical protein